MTKVIADTGALVAFLDRKDRYHEWALGQWDRIELPILTCEAVLAEASFVLRRVHGASRALLEAVERRALHIEFRLQDEASAVATLMKRYASVPMSLADACLVRMAEQRSTCRVLTLDRDFRIYRRHGRQVVPIVIPDDL